MTFGSLFAGIGGMDLGLERAGFTCLWQVEKEEYARRVLEKHWPAAARYRDVRCFLGSKRWRQNREAWTVDLIAGGFPCQDISNAGKRAGIDGERSGLWAEFARIVRLLRPRFVLVENVSALLSRGLGRVLGDLAACGYDAEWDCIPAAAVGAPHRRDRLFIVAYSRGFFRDSGRDEARREAGPKPHPRYSNASSADAASARTRTVSTRRREEGKGTRDSNRVRKDVPNSVFAGLEGHECGKLALEDYRRQNADPAGSGWWSTEPGLGRVADGIPARVDRLKGLGNAVVPHVVEWIGRRLISLTEGTA